MTNIPLLKEKISRAYYLLIILTIIFAFLTIGVFYIGSKTNQTSDGSPASVKIDTPLTAVGDINYSPFSFMTVDGPAGYDVDMIRAIANRMGRPLRIDLMQWSDAKQMVIDGKSDILLGAAVTSERRQIYEFTERTTRQRTAFFIREGMNPPPFDFSGWKGSVGVQRGDVHSEYMKQEHPTIPLTEYPDQQAGIMAVVNGSIDMLIGNYYVGISTIRTFHLGDTIRVIENPVTDMAHAPALQKGNLLLLHDLNVAIEELKNSGKAREIQERWFGPDEFSDRIYPYLVAGIIIVAVLVLIILGYLFILRKYTNQLSKTVASRTQELEERNQELFETGEELQKRLAELIESRKALAESQERFSLAMVATHDAIWDWKIESGEIYFSPGYYQMLGYADGEFTPCYDIWKQLLHPDDRNAAVSMLTNVLNGEDRTFETEFRMQTRSGEWIWILSRGMAVTHAPDGKATRIIGTHINVTDRRKIQEAMDAVNRKLNMLTSITRNEIQNQVFILLGYLDISKGVSDEPEMITLLNKMEGSVRQLSNRISFTRSYQDMGITAPKWQSLKECYIYAESHLDLKTITNIQEIGPYEIFADVFLEKALTDILENSLKHGGSVTHMRSWTSDTGSTLHLFIEDNGSGIPDDIKEAIFEPGSTGVNRGFGLFFVREVLSITDLSIREVGKAGVGAKFEIIIPKDRYRHRSED
ncbi:MAG TPA: transporter substrate-binding domain-containing protein [Methanospirillum sp.]|nr:transporter substrate-binding domain-containing protein [Methanospirillum sp.]